MVRRKRRSKTRRRRKRGKGREGSRGGGTGGEGGRERKRKRRRKRRMRREGGERRGRGREGQEKKGRRDGALHFFMSSQGACVHTSAVLWGPRQALWAGAERKGGTSQSPFPFFFPKPHTSAWHPLQGEQR